MRLEYEFERFTSSKLLTAISSMKKIAADSSYSMNVLNSGSLYECSVCQDLVPHLQTLINHDCATYVNG